MGILFKLFNRPISRDAFAKLLMGEIRAAGQGQSMSYDAEAYCLRFDGANDFLNLSNAYLAYSRAARRDRSAVLRQYAALRAVPQGQDVSLDEAKANLLPRVQSRFYHQVIRHTFSKLERKPGAEPDEIPTQPFAGELALDLIYDLPQSVQSVSKKSLQKWGLSFEDGLAIAKENLWRRSNEQWQQVAKGLYLSPWRDTHDVARIYLHDLIWQLPVEGEHVAIAPNRVTLIVTGSEDERGLLAAAQLAEKAFEFDRIVSGITFKLQGNRWIPWLPDGAHPAYWPLKKLGLRIRAMDYAEQKKMLDADNEKAGIDQFIPKFGIRQREDGSWFTLATWTDGVDDALLPEAEWIALSRFISEAEGAKVLGFVEFSELKAIAGELMAATEHYPPRYHTRAFPSAEQLARMNVRVQPA
jgi:hypothetical protein